MLNLLAGAAAMGIGIGLAAGVVLFGLILVFAIFVKPKSERREPSQKAVKEVAPAVGKAEEPAEEPEKEVEEEPVAGEPEKESESEPEEKEEPAEEPGKEVEEEAVLKEPEEKEDPAGKAAPETAETKAAREAAIASAPELDEDKRYDRSHKARLMQSSDVVKAWYSEIKNAALSFEGAKSSISWKQEKLHCGRSLIAKVIVRGKTLCLYLPLTVEECGKAKAEDVSGKAVNAAAPTLLRIKNPHRVKQAKELIAKVGEKLGLKPVTRKNADYAKQLPLKTTEELLEEGLVKVAVQMAFSDIPNSRS